MENNEKMTTQEIPATVETGKKSGWLPLIGFILALGAWFTLAENTGYTALIVAAVSLVVSAFGCHRHTGFWKNTAITAIIADTVLIVVVVAFIVVLRIALSK